MTIRATPPGQRVCFAPEIQLYAALAALSPELWPPMVEAAPRDTTEQNMNRLVELARRRELRCPFWPAWSQAIGPAGPRGFTLSLIQQPALASFAPRQCCTPRRDASADVLDEPKMGLHESLGQGCARQSRGTPCVP
jgi:hypothetical protein